MEANDTNGDGKIDLGDDVAYDTLVDFIAACD